MPRRSKPPAKAVNTPELNIPKGLLDQLVKGPMTQGDLVEMYGTEVSPEFVIKVTDEVSAEITAWQNRPLEPMYPVVFFDALRVKIRDDAVVRNKAV